jgi:dephospho-CoA kinase
MPVIGITGGMATGKSTVANLFGELGATVFSADEASRFITAPGTPAHQQIVALFGPACLLPDGQLNRAAIGQRVFSDPEARRALESITHPAILQRLRSQIEAARAVLPADAVIAVEVPLLYEAGMEDWFDRVVVVAVSEETEVARLCQRNGYDRDEAHRRIAAQMPLKEKVARADDVIWNEGSLAETKRKIEALWKQLVTDVSRKS